MGRVESHRKFRHANPSDKFAQEYEAAQEVGDKNMGQAIMMEIVARSLKGVNAMCIPMASSPGFNFNVSCIPSQ